MSERGGGRGTVEGKGVSLRNGLGTKRRAVFFVVVVVVAIYIITLVLDSALRLRRPCIVHRHLALETCPRVFLYAPRLSRLSGPDGRLRFNCSPSRAFVMPSQPLLPAAELCRWSCICFKDKSYTDRGRNSSRGQKYKAFCWSWSKYYTHDMHTLNPELASLPSEATSLAIVRLLCGPFLAHDGEKVCPGYPRA